MEIIIWCDECKEKTVHRHESYYNNASDWSIKFVCLKCEGYKIGELQFTEREKSSNTKK